MPTYKTCDVCRKRKIKCFPINRPDSTSAGDQQIDGPCTSCDRLGLACTYKHVYGKPGRRSGSSVPHQPKDRNTSMKRPRTSHSRSQSPSRGSASTSNAPPQPERPGVSAPRVPPPAVSNYEDIFSWISPAPEIDSTFGPGSLPLLAETLNTIQGPNTGSQETGTAIPGVSSSLNTPLPVPPVLPDFSAFILPEPTATGGDSQSYQHPGSVTNSHPQELQDVNTRQPLDQARLGISPSRALVQPDSDSQIEDIVPWSTISFFFRVYLGYLHSLAPIVHRPSFSQDLAMRRDRSDKDFRALCLGIAAYTIGQSPLSRMQAAYSPSELEALQHKFHRASVALLDRSYRSPSIVHIGTLLMGHFYCRSVGKANRAAIMLAEACQLVRLMRLHDDTHVSTLGLNVLDTQLYRRVFWHTYAVDITEASSGLMIHLNSFEGLPQLPVEVDDELITTAGMFEQPYGKQSYMSGFVQCVRLFPILEECLVRRRRWSWHGGGGTHPDRRDAGEGSKAAEAERRWIEGAEVMVNDIMAGLPEMLKGDHRGSERDEHLAAFLGMQRANLSITAVSVRFALYEYSACLGFDSNTIDGEDRRTTLGRQAYRTLSAMPFDDLAANGESIRGKISRILIALLGSDKESIDRLTVLQDWWDIFIQIQSVQLVAANTNSRLPSPALSPRPQSIL